jgi:hypothetical protein
MCWDDCHTLGAAFNVTPMHRYPLPVALLALGATLTACSGMAASDVLGTWISTDTTSRVEFSEGGRAVMDDPATGVPLEWTFEGGRAAIAVSDTTGAPLQIIVEKTSGGLLLHADADSVHYVRATPALETAFRRIRNNQAVAMMGSDLQALKEAQETYFALAKGYSRQPPMGFEPSPSVAVVIIEATGSTWSAVATHPATPTKCTIAVGARSEKSGQIVCQ